jgi:dTMP kinase
MFVCLEGIDGAGKSTQAKLLTDYLNNAGFTAEMVCDPGTTKLGLAIRQLILDCDDPISPNAQMLLFSSARAELSNYIRKQRKSGKIIVCDRWLLSTLVYQSALNGVDARLITDIFSHTSVSPDMCVVLDLDPESADIRKKHETRKDRYERVTLSEKQMMRKAYIEFANEPACGKNIHVINADQPQHKVHEKILDLFFSVRSTLSAQMKGITCGL